MSRIGKQPITLLKGVTAEVNDHTVTVKGPKGQLSQVFRDGISVAVDKDIVTVTRADDSKDQKALHGLTRSLINNMVIGCFEGYKKQLEIQGVGYSVELKGKRMFFTLGYSHQILFDCPDGVTYEVGKGNIITVSGIDKQKIGAVSAQIRKLRPPEPYKGKGIRYVGEIVRRKAGKTVKG
ncbi:MAG: 50S ribosomal protein L6 [Candidatus Marinimicrobia bacterium]|nr:50S ribosomal protein L6 [Candidatus Neomarinimicrobiota bacterium]